MRGRRVRVRQCTNAVGRLSLQTASALAGVRPPVRPRQGADSKPDLGPGPFFLVCSLHRNRMPTIGDQMSETPLATQTAAPPVLPPKPPIIGIALADSDDWLPTVGTSSDNNSSRSRPSARRSSPHTGFARDPPIPEHARDGPRLSPLRPRGADRDLADRGEPRADPPGGLAGARPLAPLVTAVAAAGPRPLSLTQNSAGLGRAQRSTWRTVRAPPPHVSGQPSQPLVRPVCIAVC